MDGRVKPGAVPPVRRLAGLMLPALLVVGLAIVLVGLGNWQVRRLAWKEDLIARANERPHAAARDLPPASAWSAMIPAREEYRPFRLSGRFLDDKAARVFTSLSDARGTFSGPGSWIVTPFALAGGGTVLVNRGFVPQGSEGSIAPGSASGPGARTVVGLLRPDERPNLFTPADRPADNLFFARNVESLAAAKSLAGPVAPFTIDLLAGETPPGGLPQAGETRMVFTNNHLGYALTWYGLAMSLAGVFASFAWRRLHVGPGAELDATR